jgi:hypothetical protein
MPIEICATNDARDRLRHSLNRLNSRIQGDLVVQTEIVITDLEYIPTLFPRNYIPNEYQFFSRLLKNSLGMTQPKRFNGGDFKHLVVLNIHNIYSLEFTDYELDAVIAHELGHIFNTPDKSIEDYKTQTELYADYFANSMRLRDPLISGIEKYLEQDWAENVELFQLRITMLNQNETYLGTVRNTHSL